MALRYMPTVVEMWGCDAAPIERTDTDPQSAHWAWRTVGGHRELIDGQWQTVGATPNPDNWKRYL
jgi:hypothetical protein